MGLLPAFLLESDSPFSAPSALYTFLHHPLTTFFTFLHRILLFLRGPPYRPPPSAIPIKVVCISDTHSKIPTSPVPIGDLLIHAGDLTNNGTISEIQQQIDWLKGLLRKWPGGQGFQHIVVICGNHDSYFDERSRSAHDKKKSRTLDWGKIHYLEHSFVSLKFPENRVLKIYGAPQIPKCGGKEFAFQYKRGQDAWTNTIPDDVDVLVTHNPPKWHLDVPENGGLGCEWLLKEVWRVKPTLHVFGHVHAGYGWQNVWWDKTQQAFETACSTGFGKGTRPVPFSELLDFRLWSSGFQLVNQGFKSVLWTRLWGGNGRGGVMINASLTYRSTGKLGNSPHVVIL